DAGAVTLMTSFNTLNGVPATANPFLIRQILRGEWKFPGLVVSDYEAISELVAHGYAANPRDAARESLRAGIDMEMVSTAYWDHLKSLIASGEISETLIDQAVSNILRLKFQLGLFDKSAVAPAHSRVTPESSAIAQRLAAESMVLLKNQDHLLP